MSRFPPSSPLFYEEDHSDLEPTSPLKSSLQTKTLQAKKPFVLKASEAISSSKVDYPTPEPSSSLGNLGNSSPVQNESELDSFEHQQTPLTEVLQPGPKLGQFDQALSSAFFQAFQAANTNKVKLNRKVIQTLELPIDGTEFTFGRSNMCDILLMDKSKLISRKHASARYDVVSNSFVVKCFSVNALEIVVPYDVEVKKLGGPENFELIPRSKNYESLQSLSYKDLATKGLTKFSRELKTDGATTKILVLNSEAVKIPRHENNEITLIIRGIQCILAAESDESNTTDDDSDIKEQPMKMAKKSIELFKVDSLQINHVNIFDAISTPIKRNLVKNTEIKPIKMNMAKINPLFKNDSALLVMPEKIQADITATPEMIKNSKKKIPTTPHSTPRANISKVEKATAVKKVFSTPTVSIDKIKQMIAEDDDIGTETSLLTPLIKKRKSEKVFNSNSFSKQTYKKQKASSSNSTKEYDFQDPKTLIDAVNEDVMKKRKLLGEIQNLDEIKKIVVNHLAFSRLASTPLTQLRSISKKLDVFDKRQTRLILSDIECVGVIYRKGKDAAGKPLDEEYYYDLEKDSDAERVQLVHSVKGGSSLRSCRKTHKQYYWKRPPPLPKY